MNEIDATQSSGNIFVDLGFDIDEAAVMLIRIEVAARVASRIKEKGWAIAEVSRHLGITQRQASQLVKTKIDEFSLDVSGEIGGAPKACRGRKIAKRN